MPMGELIVDELYFDRMVETAREAEDALREHFRKAYGKKKGGAIINSIIERQRALGGTPRRLIIVPHPTYKSKYLHD